MGVKPDAIAAMVQIARKEDHTCWRCAVTYHDADDLRSDHLCWSCANECREYDEAWDGLRRI